MQKYRVVDIWTQERRLALRCSAGRFHLARALGVLPNAGDMLDGDNAHLGFSLLICPKSGTIFRVIFESISHATRPSAPTVLTAATTVGTRTCTCHATRPSAPTVLTVPTAPISVIAPIAPIALIAPSAMPDARHQPCRRSRWSHVASGG